MNQQLLTGANACGGCIWALQYLGDNGCTIAAHHIISMMSCRMKEALQSSVTGTPAGPFAAVNRKQPDLTTWFT